MTQVYILFGIVFSLSGGFCLEWNHQHQDEWPETCLIGKRQSPINVISSNAIETSKLEKFYFKQYEKEHKAFVKNTGHSVEIRVDDVLKIEGGGLTKDYTFDHLHFHWASEHTIDGFRFPLEMHFVHYATRYKNLANALNFDDGLAVLGAFAHMSPDDDYEFEAFTQILEHIENNHNSFHMDKETVMRNFLPRDVAGFYRYNGSLTTPNCTESVIWTIFTNTVPISKAQVKRFQSIQSNSGELLQNYRNIQKLGSRKIYHRRSPMERSNSNKLNYECILTMLAVLFSVRTMF